MPSETRPSKLGRWSEPALRVLRERYLAREHGQVRETPEEMCWRVALTIASAESRSAASWSARPSQRAPASAARSVALA